MSKPDCKTRWNPGRKRSCSGDPVEAHFTTLLPRFSQVAETLSVPAWRVSILSISDARRRLLAVSLQVLQDLPLVPSA